MKKEFNLINKKLILRPAKVALKSKFIKNTYLMFEPYAVKVARTVLRGGKPERAYLSRLDTPVVFAVNYECHRLDLTL